MNTDFNKDIEKVWKSFNGFEDILNFGLQNGFITNADIIHASDIYSDPNKEYTDEEVKEMIASRGLQDVIQIIQTEYSLDDIVCELPKDEILDSIDESDLLDKLDGSWELDQHDEEVKNKCYEEIYDEITEDLEHNEHNIIEDLQDGNPDDLRKFFCDLFEIGYYDEDGLFDGFKRLFKKLEKSTYKHKEEHKWNLEKE